MAETNVNILTLNIYDTDSFSSVYDTSTSNGKTTYTYKANLPTVLFTAKQISWTKIYSIWDECTSFYPGKFFEVLREEGTEGNKKDVLAMFGNVNENRAADFKENGAKDESTYVGTATWTYGADGGFVITGTNVSEETKTSEFKKEFKKMLNAALKVTIKNTSDTAISLAKNALQTFKSGETGYEFTIDFVSTGTEGTESWFDYSVIKGDSYNPQQTNNS